MPNFLDELLLRSQGGAGAFLSGYGGTDLSGGLVGGFESLYKNFTRPTKYDVDAITGASVKAPPPRPPLPEIPLDFGEEELPFPEEIQISPGVSTVGGKRVPSTTMESKDALTPRETRTLIDEIRDMSSGLSEIRLPDGTVVKGITPDKVATQAVTQPVAGAVPTVGGQQVAGQQETAGGFLSQVGNFLGSPEFQYLAGRVAQAIVPDQTHGVNVAGGVGAQLGINRAYGEYSKRLASGESFDSLEQDRTFNILPPELKAQALRDVLSVAREGVTREYTQALTKQAEAVTAGQLTREDILRNRAIDDAVRLKVAQIGDNNWMNIGQGHVFNIDTGEIVKAYDYQTGGSGVGNLNASDYRLFNEYTTGVFLPLAMANKRREIVQQQGESAAQVADLTRYFRNEDGSTNFQAIMNYLTDSQRQQFAQDLNQYTFNAMQGLPPTTTFLTQQAGIKTVVNPETGQTEHWRINPDGTATKVR